MMKMSSGSTPIPKPATLRFGVFFDGTGNNRHNAMAVDEPRGSYGNALSNVALLHALYPAGEADADGTRVFLKRYVEGVGTLAGEADHAYAAATGRGRTGVEARVAETLQGMAEQLRGWCRAHPQAAVTRVEFDLFGFSRGAAAARHLANLLQDGAGGLLPIACDTSINFIGLFDTVAAIIAPLQGDFDPADSRQGGLRLGLGAGIARQVVQLVAGMSSGITFRWWAVVTTLCCRGCIRISGAVIRKPCWSRCCCASRSPSVYRWACVSSKAVCMPR